MSEVRNKSKAIFQKAQFGGEEQVNAAMKTKLKQELAQLTEQVLKENEKRTEQAMS
jgi:hypothetical protein